MIAATFGRFAVVFSVSSLGVGGAEVPSLKLPVYSITYRLFVLGSRPATRM
jgi:hypothetical protein